MIVDVPLPDWDSFKTAIRELDMPPTRDVTEFIFRGQADAEWPMQPSFSRTFKHLPDPSVGRDRLVEEFRREIILLGQDKTLLASGGSLDAAKLWPIGQHHGLPTPLLDWSTSPYVAAYFACEAAFDLIIQQLAPDSGVPEGRLAILALRRDEGGAVREIWSKMGITFIEDWSGENSRIRNQLGLFSLLPDGVDTLDACLEAYCLRHGVTDVTIYKYMLPYDCILEIMADLALMDITPRRIYGGWEGVCKAAKLRLQLAYARAIIRT
jgi:hypothetical protein